MRQKNKTKISIIIPNYNQGEYILETLDSVYKQTCQDFEVIIVDDGSTDNISKKILSEVNNSKVSIFFNENKGVCAARNFAISKAVGEYILPLDADDKIAPDYLEKAMNVFSNDPQIGVVYCEAVFFDKRKGKWNLPEFSFPEILLGNQVFCSAFFRKKDFLKTKGYNPNMIYGWEDWDLWLSFIELELKFYRIPEILFYYRIKTKSRSTALSIDKQKKMHTQIFYNHQKLFTENIFVLFNDYYDKKFGNIFFDGIKLLLSGNFKELLSKTKKIFK